MKNSFGERLKIAFNQAINADIAKKLEVSEGAVSNYVRGRVPDAEKLLLISKITNCSIDWLLTGKGEQFVDSASEKIVKVENEGNDIQVLDGALFSINKVNEFYGNNDEDGIDALEVIYHEVMSLVKRRKLKFKQVTSQLEES